MTLPTCPREDCAASDRHYHQTRTGGARPCPDSPRHCEQEHTAAADDENPCYAPRTPQPQPAAVVLPTAEEVARLAFMEYWLGMRGAASPLSAQPSAIRASWARAAQAVLDLIAGRITPWQPVEPGTVIKAGTVTRIEWGDRDAREAVTRADYTPCQTDPPTRYYLDPRTVPAEPEDPRIKRAHAIIPALQRVKTIPLGGDLLPAALEAIDALDALEADR